MPEKLLIKKIVLLLLVLAIGLYAINFAANFHANNGQSTAEKNNSPESNATGAEQTTPEASELQPEKVFPSDYSIVTINGTSKINTSTLGQKIHSLVNAERMKLGLSVLDWNDHLSYIAWQHSKDMSVRGYFEHNDPEGRNFAYRYNLSGFKCNIVISTVGNIQETAVGAENLFLTHVEQRDWLRNGVFTRSDYNTENELAIATVQGWMNSTVHREDIIKPFWKTEGIGIVISENNTVYVTENFC